MKIFKNLFSRHPPRALMNAELEDPEKRTKFRNDLIRYFNSGEEKTSKTFWIKYHDAWLLICSWATPEMMKLYRYVRKKAPVHEEAISPKATKRAVDQAQDVGFMITYVTPKRIATCPKCASKYRNVSGPFPRKVVCKICQQKLLLILDEKI